MRGLARFWLPRSHPAGNLRKQSRSGNSLMQETPKVFGIAAILNRRFLFLYKCGRLRSVRPALVDQAPSPTFSTAIEIGIAAARVAAPSSTAPHPTIPQNNAAPLSPAP